MEEQSDVSRNPALLVGRLQREIHLPWTHLNALKIKLEFNAAS